MSPLQCMGLPGWEKFFEINHMAYVLLDGGRMIMAVGEKITFYGLVGRYFCQLPGLSA